MPHLMHFSASILKASPGSFFVFFFPVMASAGQALMHLPHRLQTSERIRYRSSARHTFAGHRLLIMCSSYSSWKYRMVERTGLGAVAPSWQSEASAVTHPNSFKRSM